MMNYGVFDGHSLRPWDEGNALSRDSRGMKIGVILWTGAFHILVMVL